MAHQRMWDRRNTKASYDDYMTSSRPKRHNSSPRYFPTTTPYPRWRQPATTTATARRSGPYFPIRGHYSDRPQEHHHYDGDRDHEYQPRPHHEANDYSSAPQPTVVNTGYVVSEETTTPVTTEAPIRTWTALEVVTKPTWDDDDNQAKAPYGDWKADLNLNRVPFSRALMMDAQ